MHVNSKNTDEDHFNQNSTVSKLLFQLLPLATHVQSRGKITGFISFTFASTSAVFKDMKATQKRDCFKPTAVIFHTQGNYMCCCHPDIWGFYHQQWQDPFKIPPLEQHLGMTPTQLPGGLKTLLKLFAFETLIIGSVLSGESQSFMQIHYSASLTRLICSQSPALKDRDCLVLPLDDSKLTSTLTKPAVLRCAVILIVAESSK